MSYSVFILTFAPAFISWEEMFFMLLSLLSFLVNPVFLFILFDFFCHLLFFLAGRGFVWRKKSFL